MKTKLIKIDNYLLLVSDKENENYLSIIDKKVIHEKIIAYLPLNGAEIIGNLPLLPPLEQEDDVEKLAEKYVLDGIYLAESEKQQTEVAYMSGYNKAKEKYKYTEEDIYKAIQYGREVHYTNDQPFIQYLSQPKLPVAFKCEIHDTIFGDINTGELLKWKPKTITNSQGQTIWVGEYIY